MKDDLANTLGREGRRCKASMCIDIEGIYTHANNPVYIPLSTTCSYKRGVSSSKGRRGGGIPSLALFFV